MATIAGAKGKVWRFAAAACVAAALLVAARRAPAWQEGLDPDYWQRSNLPQMGIATYYAKGMMEYVVDYRLRHGQLAPCAECVGAVALLRAGDIGRKVWLQLPGSNEVAGPFLVVDCARREDVPMLLDRNWAVDVSFELGQTWSMSGPLNGVIVWPDPAEASNPPPLPLPTQFYIDPGAVVISVPTPERVAPPAAPLPTRLPAPRPSPVPPAGTPAAAGPIPALPVVTTPTAPANSGPAAAAPEMQVALGRPGQELLLLAARPASFLQTATPAPAARPSPSPTLSPTRAAVPGATPAPILAEPPAARPLPPAAGEPGLLQRVWRALLGLFGTRPSP